MGRPKIGFMERRNELDKIRINAYEKALQSCSEKVTKT